MKHKYTTLSKRKTPYDAVSIATPLEVFFKECYHLEYDSKHKTLSEHGESNFLTSFTLDVGKRYGSHSTKNEAFHQTEYNYGIAKTILHSSLLLRIPYLKIIKFHFQNGLNIFLIFSIFKALMMVL